MPGQPFSQNATNYLASLALNKMVSFKEYGTDRYGRTLAIVYCAGRNVNLEIVKAGLAEVYRGTPARGFDNSPYWKTEGEARKAGRGDAVTEGSEPCNLMLDAQIAILNRFATM